MNDKIEVRLEGVPQTLLLPLLGRAKISQESYSPIKDTKAIELVQALNYDFSYLLKQVGVATLFWMARAWHFDEAIKHYLKQHPAAVIVNLGAGLDTTFSRVDNGQLTWVDIDLPEVIALRQKLLPPSPREHYIAKSILDFSWIDDIKQYGSDFFFFAGGVFMYFTEAENKLIFSELAARFPRAELIFDSISKQGMIHASRMLAASKMQNAVMHWGLDNSDEIKAWSLNIHTVTKISNFKGIKGTYKFPRSQRIKMFLYDFFDKSGIIHLKFM